MGTVELFWAKVDKSRGPDGCWLWTAAVDKRGYGKFSYTVGANVRKNARAHRFAFETTGQKLGDMYALHSCDTPACVNPAHLRPGTAGDNARDAVSRGRMSGGEKHARATHALSLTPSDVIAIRVAALAGERYSSIATRYPVQRRQISRIAQGTRYAWVTASEDRSDR